MTETTLKNKIVALLRERGIFCARIAQGPRSSVGMPDIIGIMPKNNLDFSVLPGRMFAIEAKRPGRYKNCWDGCKKDSPTQYKFLIEVARNNGVAICTDSLEEVEAVFNADARGLRYEVPPHNYGHGPD